MTFYNFLLLNNTMTWLFSSVRTFFFRKKAPLSVLKVFLQSGNQLLLKIDYGKSKRRTIFFEYKKQEKHSSMFINTPLSIKFFYVAYFFFLRCLSFFLCNLSFFLCSLSFFLCNLSFFLRSLSLFSRNDINPYLPPFILRANQ